MMMVMAFRGGGGGGGGSRGAGVRSGTLLEACVLSSLPIFKSTLLPSLKT